MSFFKVTPSRVAGFVAGFILGAYVVATSADAQTAPRTQEPQASGVRLKLKEGARSTIDEVAKRNNVTYSKKSDALFGFTILERDRLVPLAAAQDDAARLRDDRDVLAASAEYVIQTQIVTTPVGGAK